MNRTFALAGLVVGLGLLAWGAGLTVLDGSSLHGSQDPVTTQADPEPADIATWNLGSFGDGNPETCAWAEDFFPHRNEATLRAMADYIQEQEYEVLALQEVESEAALERLTQFLPEYESIVARDSDCLRPAFIYQPEEVELSYDTEISSVAVSPNLRPALVVNGQFKREDGLDFRLVNVHLKCCEGQENERTRDQQLSALNRWLREAFQGQEDDIMVLGDFNEQLLERPDVFAVLANGIRSLDLLTEDANTITCRPQDNVFPQPVDHIVGASSLRDEYTGNTSVANIFTGPGLPLASALLSFVIDGARTMLIAGTRSAGKSSLLGSLLTELMKRYRVCTVEDTLELPVPALIDLGYNMERMKSRSVITQIESELAADEAIRTALRLGDSVLIVGEVRSREAQALYEAMRIGALANFVGGTIHGDSAYGVFDRVVNDLGVPPTSFKATDIVVICNTLSSPDGMTTYRRVTSIVEVRKDWSEDPLSEKAFVELMTYDAQKDELVPTDTLLNGESYVLNSIAETVRDWKDNWEAVWNNILLRARIKENIVEYSTAYDMPELMEAEYVVQCNEKFHEISEQVKDELGVLDHNIIYQRWQEWFEEDIGIERVAYEREAAAEQ